jgi:hypothetical protein
MDLNYYLNDQIVQFIKKYKNYIDISIPEIINRKIAIRSFEELQNAIYLNN